MSRTKPTTPLTDTVFTLMGALLLFVVIYKTFEGGCLDEPFNPTPAKVITK